MLDLWQVTRNHCSHYSWSFGHKLIEFNCVDSDVDIVVSCTREANQECISHYVVINNSDNIGLVWMEILIGHYMQLS